MARRSGVEDADEEPLSDKPVRRSILAVDRFFAANCLFRETRCYLFLTRLSTLRLPYLPNKTPVRPDNGGRSPGGARPSQDAPCEPHPARRKVVGPLNGNTFSRPTSVDGGPPRTSLASRNGLQPANTSLPITAYGRPSTA